MRSRRAIWILICLLLLAAGTWLLLSHRSGPKPLSKTTVTVVAKKIVPQQLVPTGISAPKVLPATLTATNTQTAMVATTKTNKFSYRLSNTAKTIGELKTDSRAILLQNAFIDTREGQNISIPKNLQAKGDAGAYIVQANGPINPQFRTMLTSAGGQIVSYIPNNAYLVHASANVMARIQSAGFPGTVLPYEPYYKLSPSFLTEMGKNPDQPLSVSQMRVAAYPGSADATAAALRKSGAKIVAQEDSPFGEVFTVQNVSDVAVVAQMPSVQLIEPFYTRVIANDLARVTMGISTNTTTPTNYMGLTGLNVMVEVNDTGIDANHLDLLQNGSAGNPGTGPSRVFGDAIQSLVDTNGHGTHVAGIIAGNGSESFNVPEVPRGSVTNADFRGKAPMANLYSIGFLGDDTNVVSDRYLQESAAKTNALISNNSWILAGDNQYDLSAASFDAAVRDALPTTNGSQPVLFVFSAGNDGGGNDGGGGGDADTVLSPATAKNVVTVGAIEQLRNITNIVTVVEDDGTTNKSAVWQPGTDSSFQVAGYSARGNVGIGTEGDFGRFKPDIVAPGSFVVSLRSEQWDTNAYYNPTNYITSEYTGQFIDSNAPNYYGIYVPGNAVGVNVNILNPTPPTILPLYVSATGYPDPNTPGTYDFSKFDNKISIPPDGGGAYLQTILNNGFNFAVVDTNDFGVNYDLSFKIATTNNVGDYFQVLQGLNETLAPWYRYESGTSMSAPAVSGFLALIQDYFTNTLHLTPSPALLKAMLVNGSRATGNYKYAVTNDINFQGWGVPNLTNSLPPGITNSFDATCSSFFLDQDPANALATGDSHTFLVTITNATAQALPLRVTLAWTDPPGDPAAAIKLVNNLDLVVTNLSTSNAPAVYYGNDFGADGLFTSPTDTNTVPNVDSVNNIENVFLPSSSGGTYSVTVVGRSINVNAVTAQTNNYVQDFALMISCGEGQVTNAMTVSDLGISSNPTGSQTITGATTNGLLLNQTAGGNTPLLGTNSISIGTNTTWGTNGMITLGMTNQWHFFVVTNTTTFTNAAFITFLPSTLAIPRGGVFADSAVDATRPEADIDMYVARSSAIANASDLTNLNPQVVATADKALTRGGTEFVAYTDAQAGEVYYVGVKSEDHEGAEFGFIPIFSEQPFSQQNANGDVTVNGLILPQTIPDGSPVHPGIAYVFGLALQPVKLARVVVTNTIEHQNFGDLVGLLSHNGTSVVLNNHDSLDSPPPPGPYTTIYDDSNAGDIPGAQPSDGPGILTSYLGEEGSGVWLLTEVDDALTQTGAVTGLTLFLQKYRNPQEGINVEIQPNSWFYTYVDVPVGITNLLVAATNLPPTSVPPIQMYLRYGSQPDQNNYDLMCLLTNGIPPGNILSDGPPLTPGRYYIGLFNPGSSAATVFLLATLNGPQVTVEPTILNTNVIVPILDDAISSSSIFVDNTNPVGSVNVGMVVTHPRISDLTFTLVSPNGQRILLMENRGGLTATNAGHLNVLTNYYGTEDSGDVNAETNVIPAPNFGTLIIHYNFLDAPDSMDVYYDGTDIFSIYTNNPPDGSGGNLEETFTIPYGPGAATNITIIMNQNGNTNADTQWSYTPSVVYYDYNYLTFTEDTNLTDIPIKFAIPPFDLTDLGTNYDLSGFELETNQTYFAPTNIFDGQGSWYLPTNARTVSLVFSNGVQSFVTNTIVFTNNQVSVVTDPGDAFSGGISAGSNFLALANGYILRTNSLIPQRKYSFRYLYRGPGISGWWRGEGDASDSADPERIGQNGSLIGRFDFPAGEVSQSFEMENNGDRFDFAGTNSYVQIRQVPFPMTFGTNTVLSSALDVGTRPGLTVEGWINPTNTGFQQPLVEWMAAVPTNLVVDTNFSIVAGPFLDRATGHYYYLLNATNWPQSEYWATQLGGHLATVDTANEQNWIFDAFGVYGGTNRNLWIGLTNFNATQFGYVSGLTNVVYTNWATGQPTNCGDANYTFISGNTNFFGLWFLSDSNGFTCAAPAVANKVFGVVEVDNLQTNGVQFWISVTNQPGTTNFITASNGCLYADLVDITNGDHIIFSGPNLIQSNIFQHVALTYDTNSGIANLYYQGTNVASTNLGYFIPKTTGDVLLGRDMSMLTNNYFGGLMDEMSIYSRALSPAEIYSVYNLSASTTNRLIGKFDPSVTPPLNLAEAKVVLGTMTNMVLAQNSAWQSGGFTFTALTNSLIMQVFGLEPGILFDDFSVVVTPIGNLYYLPEQSLDELKDVDPYGDWTLEIWDNRVGAIVTNSIVSWQLQFVFKTNTPPTTDIDAETPTTLTVPPGQTIVLNIDAPSWANHATNILVSSDYGVDMFYNQSNAPDGTFPPDTSFFQDQTTGTGVLSNGTYSVPNFTFIPGRRYYLGIHNPNTHSATVVVEVNFDITALTNDVIFNGTLKTNDTGRYFSFDVDSNAVAATFQLLKLSSNADLVIHKGTPLPTLTSSDYGSFNVSNLDENIYVLANSSPVPLSSGRWFAGVIKRGDPVVNYTILAKELTNAPTIIPLQNGVPYNFTNSDAGAELTNFFSFTVTNSSPTNLVKSIRFELYHLTGNGDLTVQTSSPLTNVAAIAPPYFQSSTQPGTIPELIFIQTNSALTNLARTYYLGVPNHETNAINFTIFAIVDTNLVFPAFPTTPSAPGAEGAGAGAAGGGRLGLTDSSGNPITNTVYHVTTLDDSGGGTLRDAVSSGNRTIVFDVAGMIFLQSPLIITNSYLTIAGQTAPRNGITVAGKMTEFTGVHDVIVRDIRFRTIDCGCTNAIWTSDFENPSSSTVFAGSYFAQGWHVDSGSIDWLNSGGYTGNGFVDLAGNGPGQISTNVTTVPGLSYKLNFAYAKNDYVFAPPSTSFQISINGSPVGTVISTMAKPNWLTTNFIFAATSSSTMIAFKSLVPPTEPSGTFLDTVTLTPLNNGSNVLQFVNASNVIADHISTEWSDADLSLYNSTNMTVQWSMISDSLYNSTNSTTYPGYGSRLRNGSGVLSLHHNLYADNYTGNPRLGDSITLDYINNVIYNWGTNSGFSANEALVDDPNGFTNRLNYIGNYLIATTNAGLPKIAFWGGSTNTWIYQTNNFIDSDTNSFLNGANTGWNMFTNRFAKFDRAFSVPPVSVDEAYLAYEKVLALGGPNMGLRDYFDTNIIYKARSQTDQAFLTVAPLSGMVAWWRAEKNALDSVGTYDGMLTNGAAFTNGEVGSAFYLTNVPNPTATHFSNGQGPEVVVPYNSCWNFGSNDFTIELWANFKIVPRSFGNPYGYPYDGIFISDDQGSGGNKKWWFALDDGKLDFHINGPTINGGAGVFLIQQSFTPQTNVWYHFAVTRNGNLYTIFTNGVAIGSQSDANVIPDPAVPLEIGGGDSFYFNGSLDEVAIYRRALSSNEIAYIYQMGSAGKFSWYSNYVQKPYLDTDQDGLSDFWEMTFDPANVFVPSNNRDRNGDAYTDLEEYNNWLAGLHALTITNTPVGVDLQQMFGQTGNLSFSVTNPVFGSVYLTNIWNGVTNAGIFSNSIAIFTPTNTASTTNFYGYASFDVTVTNNDTLAYFGPQTVSVLVSTVPITYNTNMPTVIITLTNKIGYFNTNSGGSDYYKFTVPTNALGVVFQVTNASAPVTLVARYGLPLPSLSSYDYISANPGTVDEQITVLTNSSPVKLQPGDWYLSVVNISGGTTSYTAIATLFTNIVPPLFLYPTNTTITNVIEQYPFSISCVATDLNIPELPLTYSIVTNVVGSTNIITIDTNTGTLNWTPDESQGPFTNLISISVGNGYASVTNTFTLIVLESNLPPFWTTNMPNQTNYVIHALSMLSVVDTATDTDIPANPLSYVLLNSPTGAVIDANSGIFTWIPSVSQAGSNYLITVIATDTNPPAVNTTSFSVTNNFTVTVLPSLSLTNTLPQTNTVGAGNIDWITVNVPTNADFATNILLFATNFPVSILYTTNYPPTTNGASVLMLNVTNGISVLGTNTVPTNIVVGGTYYLGVQNTNNFAVDYDIEVNFHFPPAPTMALLSGVGDLRGIGIKYLSGSLYIVGDDSLAGGLLSSYATPVLTNSVPLWQTNWPSANTADSLFGVTADASGIYAGGPNDTRTSDTVGGKEPKGLVVKYPLAGAVGSGFGGDIWDVQTPSAPGAFAYGGSEGLNAITLSPENGTNFIYATGQSQESGANGGRLYVSKLAEDSTILWTANDGTGALGDSFSQGNAIAALNGYIYSAGGTNGTPYLRKYDSNGNLIWSRTIATNGTYFGICTYANFIFVAGGVGSGASEDFLVDKWDDSGDLLWSRSYDHGSNQDELRGIVNGNGHLFGVGYTLGLSAGGADAMMLEISPATGDLISTNLFGATLDDKANGVDTDNTNLFIIGETKSYSPGTNQLMLIEYPLPLAQLTNAVANFSVTITAGPAAQLQWTAPTNYEFQVQWTTSLSSPIVWNTFTNIVTSPTITFSFTDDGSQSGGFTTTKFYRLVEYPNP
ncbi:MAG TPA: S8 family serine peptidase [Verrucomicrobiae bacterium]|nr:S8 family serine peptidase [Verrucomicrobiae bacterium]